MLDFLNQTTYSNDSLANGDMASYVMSHANLDQSEPGDGLHDDGVDSDLIEMVDNNPDEITDAVENPDENVDDDSQTNPDEFDYVNDDVTPDDMELFGYVLGDDQEVPQQNSNLSWLKTKNKGVNLNGLSPVISKYLATLPKDIQEELVATSGNDGDEHVEGSQHYEGNAIDLRYNDKAWNYMQNDPKFASMGLKTIDPNHGTAKHIHIQKKQYGGSTLVADTPEQQYKGLNDSNYDKAVLNLVGHNVIRGLDNNQPVAVTDGKKYQVLVGKHDTATFHGKVYEHKI
jgi:hypothetical protein